MTEKKACQLWDLVEIPFVHRGFEGHYQRQFAHSIDEAPAKRVERYLRALSRVFLGEVYMKSEIAQTVVDQGMKQLLTGPMPLVNKVGMRQRPWT